MSSGTRPSRSRVMYVVLAVVVIVLGLGSRVPSIAWPAVIREYAGDTLWALLVFLGIGFLWPRMATWRVAVLAGVFAATIETSQLYHAPWIDAIRRTWIGKLTLGDTFCWSDLVCYAVGVAFGALGEWVTACQGRWALHSSCCGQGEAACHG